MAAVIVAMIIERLLRRERVYRHRVNPLDIFSDSEIFMRYRFSRQGIVFLCNLLNDSIAPVTYRSQSIPVPIQILVTLRFLATGSMQLTVSDTFGISQPSVSRIVRKVVRALNRFQNHFIKFPSNNELPIIKQGFFRYRSFPNVIGIIDCSQIRIQAPIHEEVFVNRKGYHSLNCQFVTDHNSLIRNVVSKWPGSTHDSRILRMSALYQLFNSGNPPNGFILGDSGYPNTQWLLTPILRPTSEAEHRYNRLKLYYLSYLNICLDLVIFIY
jgi:hypothetical protein